MRHIFNLSKRPWGERSQAAFDEIKSRAIGDAIARQLHVAYVTELLDMLVPK